MGQNQFFPTALQAVPLKFFYYLIQNVDKVHFSINKLKSSLSWD